MKVVCSLSSSKEGIVIIKKMSSLKKPINFKALENELDDALRADELYKLQNDAKIRAIEQRVPTYEHFRGMVQAAHLRPVERSDMQKRAEVSWNHCFKKSKDTISKANLPVSNTKENGANLSIDDVTPQTSAEFLKIWSDLSDLSQKFKYLLRFRDCFKSKFFKIEVPTEFLEEFSKLSLEICSVDTRSHIIEILETFTECNRFSLSLAMISNAEKHFIELLFKKMLSLVHPSEESDRIKSLANKYSVSLE